MINQTFESDLSAFNGVLQQSPLRTPLPETIEQVRALGYVAIDVECPEEERMPIAVGFGILGKGYIRLHWLQKLSACSDRALVPYFRVKPREGSTHG